jgi:hypothetical protein
MPRVHGDGIIHFSQFDAVLHHDGPLWIHKTKAPGTGHGATTPRHATWCRGLVDLKKVMGGSFMEVGGI